MLQVIRAYIKEINTFGITLIIDFNPNFLISPSRNHKENIKILLWFVLIATEIPTKVFSLISLLV